MIPQHTIDEIISSADILETVTQFSEVHKSGKDYLIPCPACGKYDLKKKKGMSITIEKNIGKCFSCDTGITPISYLMNYQNMQYVDALKYLAELSNIIITEIADTKGPQKKLPANKLSFCDKQLAASGLIADDVKVSSRTDNNTIVKVNAFESGTLDQYGRIIPTGDDMIIWYYDLEGKPVTYQKKRGVSLSHYTGYVGKTLICIPINTAVR